MLNTYEIIYYKADIWFNDSLKLTKSAIQQIHLT